MPLAIQLSLSHDHYVTDAERKARNRRNTTKYRAAHRDRILAKRRADRAANRDAVRAKANAYRATRVEAARTYEKAWRAANPNKTREAAKSYRTTHADQLRAAKQAYHAAHRDQSSAYSRARRLAHLEEQRARDRAYHAANRAKVAAKNRAYRAENKRKCRARDQAWTDANRAWVNERARRWRAAHPGSQIPYVLKRRAHEQRAQPAWANPDAIEAFYKEAARLTRVTGIVHEVDHVYPLRGKTVSGLHCEANLQVVPQSVNRRKSNKLPDHATNSAARAF